MRDNAHQATRLDEIHGRFDPWLLGLVIAIATLGVIMVASSSIAIGEDLAVGRYYFLTRHLAFLALGLGLAIAVMRTELRTIEKYDRFVLVMCAGLLLLVFVPGLGRSVNGAHRWITLGVSNFQVVEAVKVIYIVWLASYLVRFRDEVNATWGAMLKPIGVAVVLVVLLLLQPDFGSSMLLLGATAGMLVLGGGHLKRMMLPILLLLPAVVLVAVIEPYRLRRITSFMDPWEDQLGAGYQLSNALMAVGRGELTGVGLGASVQKLSYLPEAHTDFIFSVLAEELGFVGVCLVVLLFAALVGRGLWIGLKCVEMRRHFAGYCAFGVSLMLGMQSLVSIGVNLGLLPTKGLTLPLVSSGGSSVMMTCVALGLLLRVSFELDRAQRQVARLRGETAVPAPAAPLPPTTQPPLPVAPATPVRGTSRLRQRVEPSFGAGSSA
ncbi:putative lipid II flippase FtsW [Luteimonas deserti]|uniref:Probable peptidoglycan glycosyltransferase FtsW n=1 Tax=Luteimonas deserti TaxID=2752306 RepID=A0A7Z0QTN9_9GAMM|nr:putative lipid II flippase FtsW [Luteimonas deserti]NYZ62845.1 putative lipid II flippase FtsW [Luteimonas deserti]